MKEDFFFLEGIKHNDLMSEKHICVCRVLHYFINFLIFASSASTDVLQFLFLFH